MALSRSATKSIPARLMPHTALAALLTWVGSLTKHPERGSLGLRRGKSAEAATYTTFPTISVLAISAAKLTGS